MAKGQNSKEQLFKTLISAYPDSFWEDENKILRVPFIEDGTRVEIKVTLTAAKNNLRDGITSVFDDSKDKGNSGKIEFKVETEPSQEELDNVKKMLEALDL